MKKIATLFVLLLLATSQGIFAQMTITGKVISSEDGLGLPGASVIVKGTTIGKGTDIDGNFILSVPSNATIVVSFMGYKREEIEVGNQTHFIITLEPENIWWGGEPIKKSRNRFNYFVILPQADFLRASFNNFESLLGKENIDVLNTISYNLGLEYAILHKGFYFALNHGHFYNDVELDSVNGRKGDYRLFLLGTHFGYNIIHSKRFLITPKIGITWYRHRMINYDAEYNIPMGQYITYRDLDIRFNHSIGFAGISCSYKSYNIPLVPWAIGFYGGYAFKLNDKPWVYSGNNRLTTDQKVKFNNFNFGITLSAFFDIY